MMQYFYTDNEKLYFSGAFFGDILYTYNESSKTWKYQTTITDRDICFSREDGINWKHDTFSSSDKLTSTKGYVFSYPDYLIMNDMIGYKEPNAPL